MPSFSNSLVNPTPFAVQFPFHRGIVINIEPFSSIELDISQVDDFIEGKPGSEAVQELTDAFGVFLLDNNLSYDVQALRAISQLIKVKKAQYDNFVEQARKDRAMLGIRNDPEDLEETIRLAGYETVRKNIEVLEKQKKELEKIVSPEDQQVVRRKQFDPTRTVFVMNPPKEFRSVAEMNFFLNLPENKEIKKQHLSWVKEAQSEAKGS